MDIEEDRRLLGGGVPTQTKWQRLFVVGGVSVLFVVGVIALVLGLVLGLDGHGQPASSLPPIIAERRCQLSAVRAAFEQAEHARGKALAVLSRCPLVDTHNDLPWAIRKGWLNQLWAPTLQLQTDMSEQGIDTDIPRLLEGRVGGQIWSVYVSCAYENVDAVRATQEQIDAVAQMAAKYPHFFRQARTADELEQLYQRGLFPSLLGIEGGHQIDNSLASLRAFAAAGVRYMTLTHNCDTVWAESCCGSHSVAGLTDFGRAVVAEMNRLGVVVDLSHASPALMRDALAASRAPVLFSHSNAYTLCPVPRNVPDDVLALLPANGGIVCITFVPSFTNCQNNSAASVADVADHIDYVAARAGVDAVCLGGDFDGITEKVNGLEDVSTYPALIEELVARGWTPEQLIKLIGGNVLRVLRENERVSRTMRDVIPGQAVLNNLTVATGCRTSYV